MRKNRITVFNRLIENRLRDCSFFEDLLENHYRKFSYGYEVIARNNLIEMVDDVECDCYKHHLKFTIKFNKPLSKDSIDILECNISEAYGACRYETELELSNEIVTLDIRKKA